MPWYEYLASQGLGHRALPATGIPAHPAHHRLRIPRHSVLAVPAGSHPGGYSRDADDRRVAEPLSGSGRSPSQAPGSSFCSGHLHPSSRSARDRRGAPSLSGIRGGHPDDSRRSRGIVSVVMRDARHAAGGHWTCGRAACHAPNGGTGMCCRVDCPARGNERMPGVPSTTIPWRSGVTRLPGGPNNPRAMNNLGVVLAGLPVPRTAEAASAFREAIRIDSAYATPWYNLAASGSGVGARDRRHSDHATVCESRAGRPGGSDRAREVVGQAE